MYLITWCIREPTKSIRGHTVDGENTVNEADFITYTCKETKQMAFLVSIQDFSGAPKPVGVGGGLGAWIRQ